MQLSCNTGSKYVTRVQITNGLWLAQKQQKPNESQSDESCWQDKQKQNGGRCRKVWRVLKHFLIRAKFSLINENNKSISQSTRNWKSGQHKWGLTKLLKATNRGFFYATVRNEGWLQAWIEGAHFSPYLCKRKRTKAPDNMWQRDLKFKSSI